jgi:hypothetical protein
MSIKASTASDLVTLTAARAADSGTLEQASGPSTGLSTQVESVGLANPAA